MTADGGAERAGRTNLTGRAAMLALVVCLLAISLAYPLREYLSQRGEISDYRAAVAEQEHRVADLQRQHDRWNDPAYVEAQARERLHYVMPGETSYVVLESREERSTDGVVQAAPEEVARRPWFTDLWHSVATAGRSGTRAK